MRRTLGHYTSAYRDRGIWIHEHKTHSVLAQTAHLFRGEVYTNQTISNYFF